MDYAALIKFFDEYNGHFREFLKYEYSKIDMINKGEIEELSNSLSTEQAFIMKSESLEARRISLTGKNKTFQDIISDAPDKYKPALEERYKALSEMIFKIKEINDTANIIISERLKRIRANNIGVTYDGHGVKKETSIGDGLSTNA